MRSAVAAVKPAIIPLPLVPLYITTRRIPATLNTAVTIDATRWPAVVRLFINNRLRYGCRDNGRWQQQRCQ